MLSCVHSARVAFKRSAAMPRPVRLQVGRKPFQVRLDSACVAYNSSFQQYDSLDSIPLRHYHASEWVLLSQKPRGQKIPSEKSRVSPRVKKSATGPSRASDRTSAVEKNQKRTERRHKRLVKKEGQPDAPDARVSALEATRRSLNPSAAYGGPARVPTALEDMTDEELAKLRASLAEEDDGDWEGLDELEAELEEASGAVRGRKGEEFGQEELTEDYEEQLALSEALDEEEIVRQDQEADAEAKQDWRRDRSRAYKQKRKEATMEKRKTREEFIEQRYKELYGVDLEEKDGLVGVAEKRAKSNPDVVLSSLEEQKKRIQEEVLARAAKPAKSANGSAQPRNPHPQPPGGRHERVDPLPFGKDLLWPDRPVNIHMEFPHSHKFADAEPDLSQDPLAEIKAHEKHHVPPKFAVDRGLVSQEKAEQDARAVAQEELTEAYRRRELEAERAKASLPKAKSLKQIKRLKEEATMPDWSKSAVALEDLTVHKAVHKKPGHNKATHDSGHNVEYVNASGYSFKDLGIGEAVIRGMEANWKILAPSEIQQLTLPQFMNASNLLIADQTGTGKTLSYLLPTLERVYQFDRKNPYYKRRGQRARVIILLPNRELVQQTARILTSLLESDPRFEKWNIYDMAGGTGETVKKERVQLNDGLDFLVATPERVLFHVEKEHLYLDDTMIVVIDEADTLMSSRQSNQVTNEFMESMRDVISKQKLTHLKHVQFVCATATVSPPLMEFLKKEFGDSMISVVGSEIHKSARSLRQDFLFGASGEFKQRLLYDTLKKYPGKRTIIFCNSQSSVKGVVTLATKAGYSAVGMTSDMPPKIRQRNFKQFSSKEVPILVSTDLASRGLDMGGSVEHVILYDFPTNTIDYLHRIGRTARAGAAGFVTAFLGKGDQALAAQIKDSLQEGKSLATIRPTKPDIKAIHAVERKRGPKRLPKHIHNYEKFIDDEEKL